MSLPKNIRSVTKEVDWDCGRGFSHGLYFDNYCPFQKKVFDTMAADVQLNKEFADTLAKRYNNYEQLLAYARTLRRNIETNDEMDEFLKNC